MEKNAISAISRPGTVDTSIFSSDRPLYQEVKDRIVRGLMEGEWKPQEALPSEARLAERFGVSVPTLRAAISELVAAKVLMRKQGKGTFVASHNHHNVYQFFHMVPDDGPKALPRFTLLSFSKSAANADAIRDLNLQAGKEGSRVFEFSICLGINGDPVMLSQITVPAGYFHNLSEKVINEERDTIYGMYQSKYGVTLTRTVEKLRAVTANAYLARHLGLKKGQPLLQIYRIGYTFNNIPVELRTSYARTDRYHFLLKQGQAE
ncbi:MAG: GntR family transcriptional regulator [Burkholderiales bacterium]|nr:GntR family transcriptional regulator [Burkholderiales bacterium]